ncbi:MAG TPA: hypothetical protein VFP53_09835 [Sphingomicrobium sp.]|nr:hypothetical protein [Sphingomicrobium sp.]
MSKPLKPDKRAVELRPSRIRRDPVPADKPSELKVQLRSGEWEIKLALIGIVLFALAIDIIVVAISTYWK